MSTDIKFNDIIFIHDSSTYIYINEIDDVGAREIRSACLSGSEGGDEECVCVYVFGIVWSRTRKVVKLERIWK